MTFAEVRPTYGTIRQELYHCVNRDFAGFDPRVSPDDIPLNLNAFDACSSGERVSYCGEFVFAGASGDGSSAHYHAAHCGKLSCPECGERALTSRIHDVVSRLSVYHARTPNLRMYSGEFVSDALTPTRSDITRFIEKCTAVLKKSGIQSGVRVIGVLELSDGSFRKLSPYFRVNPSYESSCISNRVKYYRAARDPDVLSFIGVDNWRTLYKFRLSFQFVVFSESEPVIPGVRVTRVDNDDSLLETVAYFYSKTASLKAFSESNVLSNGNKLKKVDHLTRLNPYHSFGLDSVYPPSGVHLYDVDCKGEVPLDRETFSLLWGIIRAREDIKSLMAKRFHGVDSVMIGDRRPNNIRVSPYDQFPTFESASANSVIPFVRFIVRTDTKAHTDADKKFNSDFLNNVLSSGDIERWNYYKSVILVLNYNAEKARLNSPGKQNLRYRSVSSFVVKPCKSVEIVYPGHSTSWLDYFGIYPQSVSVSINCSAQSTISDFATV